MQREVDAVLGRGAWAEDAPLLLADAEIVDGAFTAPVETVGVELPQFVAVAAPPLSGLVVPLVLEPHGDVVLVECPQSLASCVGMLAAPFRGQEVDDLVAAGDEGVAVAPHRIR